MSILCQKASKQTSKLKTKQLRTIYDNVILESENLETDIEIENEAITDHLWSRNPRVRKPPNRHQNWKRSNHEPFMIVSFLCQKASKQTSKLKTKQLQSIMITSFFCQKASKQTSKLKTKQLRTISDNVILVSENLETDIEIENEAITNHLW